jgi:predicted phage-related endonuclease
MNLDSISDHIEIMRECKSRIKELEEMFNRSRSVVEEVMGDNEVGEVDGQVVVTWRKYKSRRLSQKYLREYCPEIYENAMETKEYRSMEIR